MNYRVHQLVNLTKEFVLPILELGDISIDQYGYMRPADMPNSKAFVDSSDKKGRFFIVPANVEMFNYHMQNIETTILFNPFAFNQRGNNDAYRLIKFVERIVYYNEIGGEYVADDEWNDIPKTEEVIQEEMEKYIRIEKEDITDENGIIFKRFIATVFDMEQNQFRTLVSLDVNCNLQVGLILIANEIVKHYTKTNIEADIKKYGTPDRKAYLLYERMERLNSDMDKNYKELSDYNKEIKAKENVSSDEDVILDTDNITYVDGTEYEQVPGHFYEMRDDDNSLTLE